MGRGKKNIKIISTPDLDIDINEINTIFQQLSGDPNKVDPEIILDKFTRLKNTIIRCNKLLTKFKENILDRLHTKIQRDIYFNGEINKLTDFIKKSENYLDEEITDENRVYFYQNLKECFIVEEYLYICKILTKNENCIKDRLHLSDSFIKRAVGEEFFIFKFSDINFKHLFTHILEENILDVQELKNAKHYILLTLNMLYISTQDIYKIISSPDIDINKFTDIIFTAIKAARKQIPRCDKAFNMISNSMDMLKSNMNVYYKDFIATNNPTIIFENFIQDVSSETNIDTKTLMQFKKIISFFRKRADSMPKNNKSAEVNSMFGILDKLMKIMEDDKPQKDTKSSVENNESEDEIIESDNSTTDDDNFEKITIEDIEEK
jgi:hypothetical protein